ncbi:Pseudouridine synthase, partial [human gut metagenome]
KSRSFIQGLIEKENVKVNSKSLKSNYKLKKLILFIKISLPKNNIGKLIFYYSLTKKLFISFKSSLKVSFEAS